MIPLSTVSFTTMLALSLLLAPRAHSQSARTAVMMARGTFEVQIAPLPGDAYADAATLGRMTIDKQFSGDLVGAGKGQMLTGMGSVKGSAAYSAIERVTGTLSGKRGSFVLQHTGVMTRGEQSLLITVVPDSGTDDLSGISGTLRIIIEGKQHSYELEYTLPATP
jgi:Protein of unknown function (DUF3224)